MKIKETKEYWMSRPLAVACVNADTSGLGEEDLDALGKVEGHIVILDDEIEFRKCCFTGLWSDCVKILEQIYK